VGARPLTELAEDSPCFAATGTDTKKSDPIPIPTRNAPVMPNFRHNVVINTGTGSGGTAVASERFTRGFAVVSSINCSASDACPSFGASGAVTSAENGAGPWINRAFCWIQQFPLKRWAR
jgi:hypothetical protein